MTQLRYRLDIMAHDARQIDPEYFFASDAALSRQRALRAAGFRVRCTVVLDPTIPGLDAPHVLNARSTTEGQGTLL